MKKVLAAIILSVVVLSLSLLAAGQAAPGSLDDQLLQVADGFRGDAAVQQLLDKGANIEAKDILGRTALLLAAQANKANIVKLLLEKGANVDAKGFDGNTALMVAASQPSGI